MNGCRCSASFDVSSTKVRLLPRVQLHGNGFGYRFMFPSLTIAVKGNRCVFNWILSHLLCVHSVTRLPARTWCFSWEVRERRQLWRVNLRRWDNGELTMLPRLWNDMNLRRLAKDTIEGKRLLNKCCRLMNCFNQSS